MFPSTKPIQCLATEMLTFIQENLKRYFFLWQFGLPSSLQQVSEIVSKLKNYINMKKKSSRKKDMIQISV